MLDFGDIQVVFGLVVAAMIGSWCNFLTVIYIGKTC